MTTTEAPKISLEQAKQLVAFLEAGEQQQPGKYDKRRSNKTGEELWFHNSLPNFLQLWQSYLACKPT